MEYVGDAPVPVRLRCTAAMISSRCLSGSSPQDTETFWVRGKNEALRKLYERAVLVATPQLEELWRDFCDFEKVPHVLLRH